MYNGRHTINITTASIQALLWVPLREKGTVLLCTCHFIILLLPNPPLSHSYTCVPLCVYCASKLHRLWLLNWPPSSTQGKKNTLPPSLLWALRATVKYTSSVLLNWPWNSPFTSSQATTHQHISRHTVEDDSYLVVNGVWPPSPTLPKP